MTLQKIQLNNKNKRLLTYQKKRDFTKTPEPSGNTKQAKKNHNLFVIQKHQAQADHYDLRLAHHGILLSWAIPKGFPTDTQTKHLAIQTEDHPLAYAHFEGTIPEGNYGAGTVKIWDQGTYTNLKQSDLDACLKNGELLLDFHGQKIQGIYALIFFKKKDTTHHQNYWLLLKTKQFQQGAL